MGRFIVRRALFGVIVLLIISFAVFFLFFVIAPGDPAAQLRRQEPRPEQIEMARRGTGSTSPPARSRSPRRLSPRRTASTATTWARLFKGDLGYSFRNRRAGRADPVRPGCPTTASLAIGAAVVWLLIGIPIGILAATKPRSLRDRGGDVVRPRRPVHPVVRPRAGVPLLVLLQLRTSRHHVLPRQRLHPVVDRPARVAQAPDPAVDRPGDGQRRRTYSRITRGSLLEVLGEDYIRTARAKGLSGAPGHLPARPAQRPDARSSRCSASTSARCSAGPSSPSRCSASGASASWPSRRCCIGDLPVIFGTVLLAAFFIVVANILVDIAYALLDSRVRLA